MYAFYGISEWKRSSAEKKKLMVKDFIVREGAYYNGRDLGLDFSPAFFEKSFTYLQIFSFQNDFSNDKPNFVMSEASGR